MSLFSDTQDLLNDSGVFWLDEHVHDRLNQAQMELWGRLRHDTVVSTSTALTGNEFLQTPATLMIPQRVVRNNVEWFSTSRAQLEQDNRKWRVIPEDAPKWFMPFDANRFQMVPKPDANYEVLIWGVRYPANEISAGTVDITPASHYMVKFVMFKAAALLALNSRADLFQLWKSEAESYFVKASKNLRKRMGHTSFVLRPGKRTARAHMGSREIGKSLADERNV